MKTTDEKPNPIFSEKENKKKKDLPFWSIIFGFAKGEFRWIAIAVIASVLTGVTVAIQPLVIKYIVDNGISNTAAPPEERLNIAAIFCLIYVGISILRVLFWAFGYRHALKALEGLVFRIRAKFFYHVEHLCMSFHEKNSAGELYNHLMGSPITNIRTYLSQMILSIPYQSVSFVISAAALLTYDWLLTLVLLCTLFLMVLCNFLARKKMRRIASEYIKKETETSQYLTDILHGMDAIKIYSIEDNIFKNFRGYARMIREEGVRLNYSQYLAGVLPELVTFIGTAFIYIVGAVSCIYRGLSTGTLFAFINSMGIIMNTMTTFLNMELTRQSAVSGLEKIMNVINRESTTPDVEENKKRDVSVEKEATLRKNGPCIEFENVDFSYEEGSYLYKNLSCQINYKESIGLVGSSGSGKSTFTKLVMRLYDVQNGTIKVHGRNIKDFKSHDLRMTFGVVPQNPFIFHGTIMDNIRIARPDCENIDIIRAMEIAHVHEFVNDLPKGWHTVIGDGGMHLSGGQKQRIAIARAVLGNPDILIFDEATSALDNVSERHIQEAMETLMQTHTVLIVAHRLTTIKNVDRIMVFDKGEIVEEGSYDELAQKEGGVFCGLLNN